MLMLKIIILLQLFITNKMLIVNKIFIINELYDIESSDKLIEKFIKPKIRKLSKLKNYLNSQI